MKLTKDKPFQLKQVKGTIVDTRDQTSWNFTEKNIIHIELEQGSKKLFYEANDEFKQNQTLLEGLEKIKGKWHRMEITDGNFIEEIIEQLQKDPKYESC